MLGARALPPSPRLRRILRLLAIIVLLPILGASWAALHGRQLLVERVSRDQLATAEASALYVASLLEAKVDLLELAAFRPGLLRSLDTGRAADIHDELQEILDGGHLRSVLLFDADNHVVAALPTEATRSAGLFRAPEAAATPIWFVGGEASAGLRVAVLRKDGGVAGYLVGELSLTQAVADLLDSGLRRGASISLVDKRGTVLTGHARRVGGVLAEEPAAFVRQWQPGTARYDSPALGRRQIGTIVPLRANSRLPLAVLVEQSEDAAFGTADFARNLVLFAISLLGLGGCFLGWTIVQSCRTYEHEDLGRQHWMRRVLDSAPEAFVAMDETGRIVDWNREAEALFGWPREDVVGRTVADTIVPEGQREAHRRGLAHFLRTGQGVVVHHRTEMIGLRRDGNTVPVELTVWPVRIDDHWRFHAFLRDTSAQRLSEATLRAARDEAVAASRRKSEFLANMSHEIRTPMNGILGLTGLLLASDLDPEQRADAETVRSSAEALLALLNDFLDMARIEAGKLRLEVVDFDVRATTESVCALLAGPAQGKGLVLSVLVPPDMPALVRGDPVRVRQILFNLVGNAVKFTDRGEIVVRARAEADPIGGWRLRFEVQDTGIGIPAEAQERLFQAFEQVDSSATRRHGGSGLGLAISRRLVELMGGTIDVQSEPGRGSTFRFDVRVDEAAGVGPPTPRGPDLQGIRALIVEPHETTRTTVEAHLHGWGVETASATTAAEAMGLLQARHDDDRAIQVLLVDRRLPDGDALELVRQIRARADWPRVQVVLLVPMVDRVDGRVQAELGIDAQVTLPVRQAVLADRLAGVLGREPAPGGPTGGESAQALPPTGSPPRILVVDDNPVNQAVSRRILERLGCRVDVAGDGVEAIAAWRRERYDAVLMDCQMPVLDGYSATRILREIEGTSRHTPIIALTASVLPEDRARCLAAGMDDYVSKPVTVQALTATVLHWVGTAAVSLVAEDTGGLPAVKRSRSTPFPEGVDADIVSMFLEQTVGRLARMREQLGAADDFALATEAHNLKGTAGTVGAMALATAAAELERAAATQDMVAAAEALERVAVEVDAAHDWLENAVAGDAEPPAA